MPKPQWLPDIPITDYQPDMPQLGNPGSELILNAIPRTPKSYGPMPRIISYGGGLGLPCQGAYACRDSGDNVYIFAGDQENLYDYTSNSTTPNTISNGTNPYNCASDSQWHFAYFGGRVIATDYESVMQSFVLGSSTDFADLANGQITALTLVGGTGYTPGTYALTVSNAGIGTGFTGTFTVNSGGVITSYVITAMGNLYPTTATISIPAGAGAGSNGSITPTIQTIAPNCKYMAVIKNFLMCGFTNDPVYGIQPQAVWWSADNDPTNWPVVGTANAAAYQSSFNNLYGDGGQIQGVVGNLGTSDGAIFMEHAVWRVNYAGAPDVFNFSPAEGVRGTPAPGSLVQLGSFVYYLGEDDFYVFDGTNSQSIGQKEADGTNRIAKMFFGDADPNWYGRMSSSVDPVNHMIWWAYVSTVSGATAGIPNKMLGYNWLLDKWCILEDDMSPGSSFVECLLRSYTFGNTLDSVGSVSLDTAAWNIFPMDSAVWTGGIVLLGGFSTSLNGNTNHGLSYFNGANYGATIETSEMEMNPSGRMSIVDMRPLCDISAGTMTGAVMKREKTADPVPTPVYRSLNSRGTCPQVVSGRYIRTRTMISSGATWNHFQGVKLKGRPCGEY
jgi:hypothetical protein